MDLKFVLKFYQGDKLRAWMEQLFATGFSHGSDLVLAVEGADNCYAAERLLQAAEEEGWITRCSLRPTPEQQFFDSAGWAKQESTASPYHYGWSPVRTCKRAIEFIEDGGIPT